jgi:hypothetical protein
MNDEVETLPAELPEVDNSLPEPPPEVVTLPAEPPVEVNVGPAKKPVVFSGASEPGALPPSYKSWKGI